jgi:hypothetical protein
MARTGGWKKRAKLAATQDPDGDKEDTGEGKRPLEDAGEGKGPLEKEEWFISMNDSDQILMRAWLASALADATRAGDAAPETEDSLADAEKSLADAEESLADAEKSLADSLKDSAVAAQ